MNVCTSVDPPFIYHDVQESSMKQTKLDAYRKMVGEYMVANELVIVDVDDEGVEYWVNKDGVLEPQKMLFLPDEET